MSHDGMLARAYDSVHGEGAFAKEASAAINAALDRFVATVPPMAEPPTGAMTLEAITQALAALNQGRRALVVHPDFEERAREVVERYAFAPKLWRVVANPHIDRDTAMVMPDPEVPQ